MRLHCEQVKLKNGVVKFRVRYWENGKNIVLKDHPFFKSFEDAKSWCVQQNEKNEIFKLIAHNNNLNEIAFKNEAVGDWNLIIEEFLDWHKINAQNTHETAKSWLLNYIFAIPALRDPYIVWEIKEYWGKTGGGSKMSDAVYECHLVGREIRDYEKKSVHKITHVVFIDGKDKWNSRKSDLARFIDLHNQGVIDYLFIGKTIETEWEKVLHQVIQDKKIE